MSDAILKELEDCNAGHNLAMRQMEVARAKAVVAIPHAGFCALPGVRVSAVWHPATHELLPAEPV
jgi:hypothetical protein